MSESYLYLASYFFQNLFLAPLHPASPILCPSSQNCPLMHSSPSHPHDHAAGVALQRVLPHPSGVPFLQTNSSPWFSPLCVYTCIHLQSSTKSHVVFLLPSPRSEQTTKILRPFLLLHFRCIFFYSIHYVFHSLSACKVAHVHTSLQLYSYILPTSIFCQHT